MTTTNLEYKDLFGNDIKEGDYLVYAAVDGRSGTLRAAKVLKLTMSKPDKWRPEKPLEPKVMCATWSNFRAERTSWSNEPDFEASGRQKNVTLSFLDRMIVVPEAQVSDKIKKDLNGPICDWRGMPIVK